MTRKEEIEKLRQFLIEDSKRPSHERFQEMIDRGVIDSEGRVLLRMPEPPATRPKAKKKVRLFPRARLLAHHIAAKFAYIANPTFWLFSG